MATAGEPTVSVLHLLFSILFELIVRLFQMIENAVFHCSTLNRTERNEDGQSNAVGFLLQFLHMAGAPGAGTQRFHNFFLRLWIAVLAHMLASFMDFNFVFERNQFHSKACSLGILELL